MEEFVLEVEGLSKSFPGVKALSGVSFQVKKGEIHGLVGENGAGKSTLIKVLCGVYHPEEGRITFRGKELLCKNPLEAQLAGISVVHQELKLVESLSVMENIFLGRPPKDKLGLVSWRAMKQDAKRLLDSLGVRIDPEEQVSRLSVAQKQIVEICKALSYRAELIIMDEPSATLTENELNTLFAIMAKLKRDGITIIYISHRLEEIFRLCDTVTVLRDGMKIKTLPAGEVTREMLIALMVGRELGMEYPKTAVVPGDVALDVCGLNMKKKLFDIHFNVRKGEILGFAGLVGAGRTEVARAIIGADRGATGKITLLGKPYAMRDVPHAIRCGIGLVTEDRKKQGLVLHMNVAENISMVRLAEVMNGCFLSAKKESTLAKRYIQSLKIATPDEYREVLNLSGGNQQKVVIAKWLNAQGDVLIVDEPTRGIDVGAKAEIYKLLCQLAARGKAIIMISSDMPELLGICDRILVMHEGRITGQLSQAEATQEKLMELAIL